MSLLVLNHPTISTEDLVWIQEIRAEHDELYYEVVDPHFALVFPVFDTDPAVFAQHVRTQANGFEKIPFVMRYAEVVDDAFNEYFHTFLVPDEGYSSIVKLHDRLYRGLLAPELHLDIPFIPHVGVGNATDPALCKGLADDLNDQNFSVSGEIGTLDIARYADDRVTTLEKVPLA